MITGYNTDIEHGDRVYHVQTEDKGLDNPVVESLIYSGGEIVTSRRSSYAEVVESGSYREDEIQERMNRQHQNLIRDVRLGKFDPEGPMPLGHEFVTTRSFDEVVGDFLRDKDGTPAELRIRVMDWQVLEEGTRPTIRMTVQNRISGSPVSGAMVCVRLEAEGRESVDLFSSPTDDQGFIEASFEIPGKIGTVAQIVCEATWRNASERFCQRVKVASIAR